MTKPEDLELAAHRLTQLFDDPQPGLFTWAEMVRDNIDILHNWLYNDGRFDG